MACLHDVVLDLASYRSLIDLRRVAQGNTDRGIAAELFVTRKTVEAHVRSILAKLDLPADPSENRRVHAVLTFMRVPACGPGGIN
jgi:DNA-binding NarL/FixJ family response regulator